MLGPLRRLLAALPADIGFRVRRSIIMSVLSGPVELFGLAAFIPLLNVLSAGNGGGLANHLGGMAAPLKEVGLATAATVLAIGVVLRGVFVALVQIDQLRTGWLAQSALSTKLLRSLMESGYPASSEANTDELSSVILSETEAIATRIVMPYLAIAGAVSTSVLLGLALILVEPLLSSVAFASVVGAYVLTSQVTKRRAAAYSVRRTLLNGARFNHVAEVLEAYREIRLSNRGDTFVKAYERQAGEYGRLMAWSLAIGAAPRYAVEAALMLSIVFYIALAPGPIGPGALASLGVFAVGAYRLLPSVQLVYHGLQNIRFGRESLSRIEQYLSPAAELSVSGAAPVEPSTLAAEIGRYGVSMERVTFSYRDGNESVLKEVTFDIAPGRITGIAGRSGSGKSTLLDIVAGIRAPTDGVVRSGAYAIHSLPPSSWAAVCSYVPQRPRLFSGSVAENVALGEDGPDLDFIQQLLATVCLDDQQATSAVMRVSQKGAIGQDGSQLSGGQRQRIGLARALYQRPALLLLDESTSALDIRTEKRVLENLRQLGVTVVLVAHRETALSECDEVVVLQSS